MSFTAESNIPALADAVRQIETGLPGAKRAALGSIGFMLLNRQQQHFQQLSRTGSSNGVTWPKLTQQTMARRIAMQKRGIIAVAAPEQIGIVTGLLAKSFRFQIDGGNEVHITNTTLYSRFFAKKRPLYPTAMPSPWIESAESITQRSMDKLTNSVLKSI